MQNATFKKGKYAELMTEYAEHLYREAISKTERNYFFTSAEGTVREVDVCTQLTSGELIAFEVRDRKGTQKIDWVDQVIGKYQGSPFSQVWICTFDGCFLSAPAIKKLEFHHIGWRDFTIIEDSELINTPVLMVPAIVLDINHAVLTIDDEPHKDIMVSYSPDMAPISYIDIIANRTTPILSENFSEFTGINFISHEERIPIEGVKSNFDSNKTTIDTKLEIPLIHKVYVDYFDEKYIVKNNQEISTLISTHEKSIFIKDNTLAIDFGFFYSHGKHVVLENKFLIHLDAIPAQYRCINTVQFMDVKGEKKVVPMKIYGIKKS